LYPNLNFYLIIILSDLPPVSHKIKGMEGKDEESRRKTGAI